MRTIKLTNKNRQVVIKKTIDTLKKGGLIVFPTDTVYGLLADAGNSKAIDKLLSFKERVPGKAISVFVANEKMAEEYVLLNHNAKNVIKNLLPGPFTVICEGKILPHIANSLQHIATTKKCHSRLDLESIKIKYITNIDSRYPAKPDSGMTSACPHNPPSTHNSQLTTHPHLDNRLFAENNTLGFRIPDYPLVQELVMAYGSPLTATSANLSSKTPHYSISSLLSSLSENKTKLIDLIVDAGNLPKNKPSTVIDTTTGQLKTLRIGDLLPETPESLVSNSEDDTKKLARFILTKSIKKQPGRPICFLLEGNLGAGKTIFAKGLAEALNIKEIVVSPTFNICNEYLIDIDTLDDLIKYYFDIDRQNLNTINNNHSNIPKMLHYDLYRLEIERDIDEIGLISGIKSGNIYVIEWPQKLTAEYIEAIKKLAEIAFVRIEYFGKSKRIVRFS